jgi:hypothetical protein
MGFPSRRSAEDHAVGERGIELGQGEHGAVAVGRLDDQVIDQRAAPQLLIDPRPGLAQEVDHRDPVPGRLNALVILRPDRLPGHAREVARRELDRRLDLAADLQHDPIRRPVGPGHHQQWREPERGTSSDQRGHRSPLQDRVAPWYDRYGRPA